MRITSRATRPLATAAAMALGTALLASSPAGAQSPQGQAPQIQAPQIQAPQPSAVQTVYSTTFDDLTGWDVQVVDRIGPQGKSQAFYRAFNVATSGSTLQVVTRRHCVKPGKKVSLNNVSEGVCKGGKKTRYSSGRLQTGISIPKGANFEAEFSALMPGTGVRGARQALWVNNGTTPGVSYCTNGKQKIVEYDALEWMSKGPGKSLHTTHIGCNPKKPTQTQRALTVKKFDRSQWHQWKVRRVGNRISYWRTGAGAKPVKVASHTCGKGKFSHLSKKRCRKMLASPNWLAIINGEVFANKERRPDNKAAFPTQVLSVDWFELRLIK